MRKLFIVVVLLCFSSLIFAQHEDEIYVPETDSLVLKKLDEWQGLKFGLLMHWGAYSQWGIVESWSICPEDYGWCERKKGSNPQNYNEYVKEYEGLQKTFNPLKFDPQKWASAAADAGMRYVVFTTKHHDGFSMFDSKYTDYKVTDPSCPFNSNPKANIAKEIFDAFRNEGLWAGAYFSKPDWHNKDYWWPYFPALDRNVNYDPELYPERWENYVQFTHNQIMELMTDYGPMDILWLDGGWVAKQSNEDLKKYYESRFKESKTGFIKNRVVSQDIRMDELVEKARAQQPGLIVVDRAVPGKNQNYLTPENRVPEKTLPYPWESCIIAGGGWSYVFDAKYMSGREAIHMLVDIVAKGGNLLYNIAPGPDGTWHDEAYQLLEEMGAWMKINQEAIYDTKPLEPYKEDKICLTQREDATYLIYMAEEGEIMPEKISFKAFAPEIGSKVKLLGFQSQLKWSKKDQGFEIIIPEKIRKNPPGDLAWVFKIF
ncbi:MAG: alpha-L-fucosidase [Bacteroidales bacterium]|nr:alpha-L-fucosidase [Bacteroidales bacterium]